MGILNVDNLRAVGSGTSVTCLSNRLETTNINSTGIVTASSFTGTINTAAQGNITSLGTLNGLVIDQNQDISMTSGSAGQLVVGGDGYTSAIALDGDAMHLYHNSSSRALVLGTNETERLRITGAGKVGISSDSPIAKLDVSGSGAEAVIRARRTDSNGGWNLFEGRSDINGANVFTVTNNGVGYFKGGIDFSAQTSTTVTNASTTAETLDHYEEGTFTPAFGGLSSVSYSTQFGKYTRIGRQVFCTAVIDATGIDESNNITLTGLPYSSTDSSDNQQRSTWLLAYGGHITGVSDATARFRSAGSSWQGVKGTASTSYLTGAQLSSSGTVNITGSFSYYVA